MGVVSDGGERVRDDGKRDSSVTGGYVKGVRDRSREGERVIRRRRGVDDR